MSRKLTDKVQFKLRFDERLRRRVEREAELAKRPMNGEIVHRLRQSFARDDRVDELLGSPHTAALLRILAGEIQLMEATEGKSWVESTETGRKLLWTVFHVLASKLPGLQSLRVGMTDGSIFEVTTDPRQDQFFRDLEAKETGGKP